MLSVVLIVWAAFFVGACNKLMLPTGDQTRNIITDVCAQAQANRADSPVLERVAKVCDAGPPDPVALGCAFANRTDCLGG